LNQQPTILTLKIPIRIAGAVLAMREKVNTYETNRHVKNITSFLILKAVTPYGVFRNYKYQLGYFASICQCSKQTILKRIMWMQEQQLLQIEGADIRLNGWKQVVSLYHVNLDEFKTIQYDTQAHKKIYLHLFATEIIENKERQAYMIKEKLKKNPALKQVIESAMLQHGADEKKLNNFAYLLNGMKLLFKRSFIAEPEFHATILRVRPDCNRSVKGIARAWCFKSAQSVSYYKAQMQAVEIVKVHKGERITSQTRARNEAAHTVWNKLKKQTVLCLVDGIEVITKTLAA
jgi:hypothetical protein